MKTAAFWAVPRNNGKPLSLYPSKNRRPTEPTLRGIPILRKLKPNPEPLIVKLVCA